MEKQAQNILSVSELAIGYGTKKVAEHINFSLKPGILCGVVGVNGIGKSTLLRTLARFQPMLSGKIELKGQSTKQIPPEKLAKELSVVLTESPASKNLTVEELIALGRQPYTNWLGTLTSQDKKYINESLDAFLLNDLRHKKCHELSDGQLQRVLIARAMAQDTPLILLDEPTTHLDLYHKVQILKLLRELAHYQQKTILFSTHEIELAIQLCDTMLILDGKNHPFGGPCQLIEQQHFDGLFPSEMVQFDPQTGTFKVNK
ncbi:ABC transporter ATP-binding protein [Flagellimonas zhangzhouensis]|uniref:Iron complex transport system ATP-binding protein n=1 Tax=Flagellimonas zhangzhouensis TaxID=1073328 RepID=A0A1H2RTT5_9FLAO|nr:ABC transporter ATP-binding protein [Allomuricauda zhangzhouensis]SDQ67614.1 iron complex transport system ATP-binding protein [Allomuricauda zhangzhouensis]SDW22737.1 iron complex transport system ATP-binding protein [Allomuricauda zhangzhouensis]